MAPAQNRAFRLREPRSIENLEMTEESMPQVQRGEVLVRVKATSLNYRDLAMIEGGYPGELRENLVQLSDGAGEIVEAGEDVRRFRVGDRVAGNFTREWFGGKRPSYMQPYGTHSDASMRGGDCLERSARSFSGRPRRHGADAWHRGRFRFRRAARENSRPSRYLHYFEQLERGQAAGARI